ncbi:hypothetical protein GCM10025868_39650 [Angustibacter aerolatus]|uniref:Aspartyl/glutamyl-tRNA(Asn/Gln) amidotransferase subunit B n=1 Tax=Angustibacter aerolatus TaxID=1162965 RepID=A0ABQ6JN88_9ACTN|nr:Asp-tRNA(Asn)/Glu-tRNA(Gln) amidotransferase subunit GatB [Angustibacter aerolatus]GMA88715.1 hypothetical protein GCM10025868_39650 [Angustibacter aerolatus]
MTTIASDEVLAYDEAVQRFDPVLGLEVHVELSTRTKMFCGCSTVFGAEPNTQVCPVCLGLPGALPVVNAAAVESAIRIGLALGCTITPWGASRARTTSTPTCRRTSRRRSTTSRSRSTATSTSCSTTAGSYRVDIERAHMEEDTGKSLHVGGATGRIHGADHSLVDYNRAGIPLIEIVTRPFEGAGDRTPEVARAYVAALRDLLRALGVSDVRMEQGSLRCDANVSLRPRAATPQEQAQVPFGTRTETKNVNSLRSVERAVRYEICRQAARLSAGGSIVQETRHWQEGAGLTTSGRPKSDADDYRYFPEPDLVPVAPDAAEVERLRATLPEAPPLRRRRLQDAWGFSDLEMRDLVNAGATEARRADRRRRGVAGSGPQVVVRRA